MLFTFKPLYNKHIPIKLHYILKLKITKRDILFLFIGLFIAFLIDTIVNWEENKQDFIDGFNSTYEHMEK